MRMTLAAAAEDACAFICERANRVAIILGKMNLIAGSQEQPSNLLAESV